MIGTLHERALLLRINDQFVQSRSGGLDDWAALARTALTNMRDDPLDEGQELSLMGCKHQLLRKRTKQLFGRFETSHFMQSNIQQQCTCNAMTNVAIN